MKILSNYRQQDIIFLDIECSRVEDKLTPGTPLYSAVEYKARHNNEYQEKLNRVGKDKKVEVSLEEFYKDKAALYAVFGRVVTIVAGRIIDGDLLKVKAYYGTDEKKLLQEFVSDLSMITAAHPDSCFCTYNGKGFDIPYLSKRMIVNGLMLPPLFDLADEKPWTIRGIDLSELWRQGSFYPDSLVSVAAALGLPSPKTNMDGSEVSDTYYAGKLEEIKDYCIQDVLVTCNIFRRFLNKSLVKLA